MGRWLASSLYLAALTSLIPSSLAAPPSSSPPVPGLPFDESLFTKLVASVQNTYCGAAANNVGQVIGDQTLLYAIGNGDTAQRCNIYRSTSLGIVVAYEGTNVSSLISILHDVNAVQNLPNPALGLPPTCLVDSGFQNAWFTTWPAVSSALTATVAKYPTDRIVVTGHSLGAAQALLGAVAVNQQFPTKISQVITFGGPRVGNVAFADAFDSRFNGIFTGVVNGRDWVPSVPFVDMGYWHPSGLVWINPANSTSWQFYPGQENTNFISAYDPLYFYPNTATLDFDDHQGIYMHSSMGTTQGPCPAQVGGY